jgi:putative tryptophan/tyrosine transport system substrate-binding protein
MRRRDFMTVLAGAAAYPRLAGAQQKAMPVIGFLHSLSADRSTPLIGAFQEGLSRAAYIDGQNITIEYRWAEGHYDRLPALAAELVSRNVDVIVTGGGGPSALAAKNATSTIPIVFSIVADPITSGLVASLARPGGNVTGISGMGLDLMPKRLELISELVPRVKVIGLLVNPNLPTMNRIVSDSETAADRKGKVLHVLKVSTEDELDAAFSSLVQLEAGALVVGSDAFFHDRRDRIAALALRHAIPTIYELRESVAAGGLISYGTSLPGLYRQSADYVGRILKGAKPVDLPVQQPVTFELVINLKTAKAIGLTIPQSTLLLADEVIE